MTVMKKNHIKSLAITRATHRTVNDRFNPAMLTTVREAQFLTQAAVADRMGVSQALIGRWEADLSTPTDEQIDLLSRSLSVQRSIFLVDRPRRLASMSDYYHRAFAKARRREMKAIHARCSIIDLQIDRLLNLVEMPEDRIPDIDPREHNADIEKIAAMTRRAMDVGPGPIKNLIALIEACGALVIDRDLEVDAVDALCRWVPELPKLFFVNGARPADRIRFSLAHELGHTILHFGRDLDQKVAEDQANAFAAAFLMPAQEIRRDLRRPLSLADLATLKRKWRVAMQAIARRAWAIGFIDDTRYRSICIQISRRGWRKAEPVVVEGESPRGFGSLLQAHLDAGFSQQDLARLLFVTETEVGAMLAENAAPNWEDHGVRLRLTH